MKSIYLSTLTVAMGLIFAWGLLKNENFTNTFLLQQSSNVNALAEQTFTNSFFLDTIPISEAHTGMQKMIADLIMDMDGQITANDIHQRMIAMNGEEEVSGCDESHVTMVDLRGSPGYAQTDYLVSCGAADTLSLLLYTGAVNTIEDLSLSLTLPKGLEYGGFVTTKSTGTIEELNVSDVENPIFRIPELSQENFIVVYIGVRANCEGSPRVSPYYVSYNLDYTYTDSQNATVICNDYYRPNTSYNNAVKEPVLNILSVTPQNLHFTNLNTIGTHSIEISQDGINSYVESALFKTEFLDLDVGIEIVGITANGVSVDYEYDAVSQELTAMLDGQHFIGNIDPLNRPSDEQFDTSERLILNINYRMPECHSTPQQGLRYSATYDCRGTICQAPTSALASLEQNPNFGIKLETNATLIEQGGFCGDNVRIGIDISGSVDDPRMGLIENMMARIGTCAPGNVMPVGVTIGGMALPPDTYGVNGGFVEIYFDKLEFDPDGDGVGLTDFDQDGFYDDLPGGENIIAEIELALVCPATQGTCTTSGCEIDQITVIGTVNCGESEQSLTGAISPAVAFQFSSEMTFPNEGNISANIKGYNFGRFSTGAPSTRTIQVCYNSTVENIDACTGGTTRLEVVLKGRSHEVFDGEMTQVSFEGSAVTDIQVTDYEDDNTRVFAINAGSNANNQELCYQFDMTFDTCVCAPPAYISLDAMVVEECGGACDCTLTKGCYSTLFYTDPYCTGCSCDIYSTTEVTRLSTGYSDNAAENKLSPLETDPMDQNRFLPGDTVLITGTHEILNAEAFNAANYLLYFNMENRRIDYAERTQGTEGMRALLDAPNMHIAKMEYISAATGQVIDLSGMACTADYPERLNLGSYVYGPHVTQDPETCPTQPGLPLITSPYRAGSGSGRDVHDQYFLSLRFYNIDNTENLPDSYENYTGDCLNPFLEAMGGSVANGDKIRLSFSVPLVKNPLFDPAQEVPQLFRSYVYGQAWDPNARTNITVTSPCIETMPYEFHDPQIEVENTMELTDCGAEISHKFKVTNPIPADWYQNEYRPIMGLAQIKSTIPAPLIYSGGAQMFDNQGVAKDLDVEEINLNPIQANYQGTDYFTPSGGSTGAMQLVFQDAEYKNGILNGYTCQPVDHQLAGGTFPLIGVGNGSTDEIELRIPVERLCPDVVSPDELEIDFDYVYPNLPDMNHINYYCHGGDNLGRGECDVDNPAANRYYFSEYTRDSRTNPHFQAETSDVYNIDDQSNDFPILTASMQRPIVVDLVDASESNTFMLCADNSGAGTHQNVVGSITLPNAVSLVGMSDDNGALAFQLAKSTDDAKVYQVNLSDIAPGECLNIYIETEQLYCTTEPADSRVCMAATSGCLEPERAAAILGQAEGESCASANACFFYDVRTSDVQAEWFLPAAGNNTLCDEFEMGIRVKNVATSQLNELMLQWWLPPGLEPISGSWQLSYPNGPTVQDPYVDIQDPVANPAADGVYGRAFYYEDDRDFSVYFDENGLQGVDANTSSNDRNQFTIKFRVKTICEEYTSGSEAYFQVDAGGACESAVSSGKTATKAIVIEQADPADFARILTIVDPLEMNCGAEVPLAITGLNTSENGGETMNSVMTIVLPTGIDYTGGGVTFTTPSDFTASDLTVETLGDATQLVFSLPDGIQPDAFFALNLPVVIGDNLDCGGEEILIDVTSYVSSVTCTDGEPCGVYVRNTVRPFTPVLIKAPLNVIDLAVVSLCEDKVDEVDLEYTFDLENASEDAYSNTVVVEVIQDLNGNMMAEDFEPVLGSMTHTVTLAADEIIPITGQLTVPESGSCPSIIRVNFDTECACDNTEMPLNDIKPKYFADLGEKRLLCPDEDLEFTACGDYELSLSPSNAGVIHTKSSADGDLITVDLNPDAGLVTPVFLNLETSQAMCNFTHTFPIYQLESFELEDYDPHVVCETGCTRLNLKLPGAWVGNVEIEWSPIDFLDDPTSATPRLCDPTNDINYTVTVTNIEGGCKTSAHYPVVIDPTTINAVKAGDCRYVSSGVSVVDVSVNVSWATPAIAGDIIEVTIGDVVATIDPHTETQPATAILTVPSTGTIEPVYVNYSKNPACQDETTVMLPVPCHAGLGDYVWHDINGDGIQDDNESAIEGATVILYDCTNGVKGAGLDTVTTDENGYYWFAGLEAGGYCVHFDASTADHPRAEDFEFSPNDAGNDDTNDSDADPDTGCSPTITLEDGEEYPDVDAGLYLPSKLGDYVWEDTNFNGVQDAGEPAVEGAEVTLTIFNADGSTTDVTVTTDENGAYCFPDLPPGDYKVTFGQPDGMVATMYNQGDDAIDSDANPDNMLMSDIVTLVSDDTIPTLDAGFIFPVSVGDTTFVDVNYNGVQDAADSPLAGVTVTLYNTDNQQIVTQDADGNPITPMATDADGHYLFTNLLPGDYYVVFDVSTAEGGDRYEITLENEGNNPTIDSDINADGESDTTGFLASGEQDLTLDAGFYIPAKLGDYVWEDLDGDGVQDEGEPAIEGAEVTLTIFNADGTTTDVTVTTDENGFYCFPDLTPGDYKITFGQPDGMVVTAHESDDATDATNSDADPDNMLMSEIITIVSNDTILMDDAGFLTPVSVGDTTFVDVNYNGLQDAADTPLEGVTATLYDAATDQIVTVDAEGNPVTTMVTDADGHYLFTNLLPGNYYVKFDVTTAENGEDYEITLENQGDDNSIDSDINTDGESDETGFLESGDQDLTLDAGFYIPAKLGDYVWEDTNFNGVQDAGEPAIEGAEVTLTTFNADGSTTDVTVTTDENGFYCFPELTPGDYKVTFGQPDGMVATMYNQGDDATDSDANPDNMLMSDIVTIISGDTIPTIDAGFVTPVSVGDTTFVDVNYNGVQDVADTPLAGVTVTLYSTDNQQIVTQDADGNPIMPMVTDADGHYLFSNLIPGDYYVVFDVTTAEDGDRYEITLENEGNDPTIDSDINADGESDTTGFLNSGEKDWTLDAGFYIPIKIGDYVWQDLDDDGIQDDNEVGLPNVTVTLTYFHPDGTTETITQTTDENGFYCFADRVPGTYKVTFTQPDDLVPATHMAEGASDAENSDANPDMNLMTPTIIIPSGDTITDFDAGFMALDLGDNPDSFGTIDSLTGANHVLQPDMYLGSGVDAERNGQATPRAGFDNLDGDDNNTTSFTYGTVTDDDENGIEFITPLIPGNEACIEVTHTLGSGEAYLTAWVDFNGNGTFSTDEKLTFKNIPAPTSDLSLQIGNHVQTLCFDVPDGATFDGGETHFRFRMSSTTGALPIGRMLGGEVEDYWMPLAKVGSLVWLDFNYDGIQNEPAVSGSVGQKLTLTAPGKDGVLGTDDDIEYYTETGYNAQGEPGYYTFCGLTEGDYKLEIDPQGVIPTLQNTTADDQDADDFVNYFTVGHLADNQPLNENGMNEVSGGNGYPDSHENLTFDFGFPGFDYGDLPDTYATLFATNGAHHIVSSDLYLGNCVDIEVNGAPDSLAGTFGSQGGDNYTPGVSNWGTCDVDGNDEDGIRFITPLIPGMEARIEVTANVPSTTAFLNTWIDYNGDGDFENDANERIELAKVNDSIIDPAAFNAEIPVGASQQVFSFIVPEDAHFNQGQAYLRFRLSTVGDLDYNGQAPDGEVEDYWLPLAKVGNIVWNDINYNGTQNEADTRGLNDVPVTLVTAGYDGILNNEDDISYTINTYTKDGIDGFYCFGGLISGEYKLEVETPEFYENTLVRNVNNTLIDSDLTGVSFTIPDLINEFLITNENSVADAPNGYRDYPDTHDDWSFDFGFAAFDYGDLPEGFPTNESSNGVRHVIGSGYVLGGCVDAELDGSPQENAGVLGTGGDDNTIGAVNDGDCTNTDDEDGVRLFTPLIAGEQACIEVKSVAPTNAVLNAWIDFNGDGDFVNDENEQLVFTLQNNEPLVNPNTQGQLPQGTTTQVFCFDVPSDAIFDGGETHFRYRMSVRGNLKFDGLATSGEVEDYWMPLAKVGNIVWEDVNYDGSQENEATETGMNGVTVKMTTAGRNGILGDADDMVYETVTRTMDGIKGRYEFCGLHSGDYRIEVIHPEGFAPTYAHNTAEETLDHDGYFVEFTVPDLIESFLFENENSAGDTPGGSYNFPDGQDNWTFDFGYAFRPTLQCLLQVGDLTGDGDTNDLNEREIDGDNVPSDFFGNGIIEVAGCDKGIPDQFMKVDFGFDNVAINPMFEYDVLVNGVRIYTAVVPTSDTTLIEIPGSNLIYGFNTIEIELYYNDGITRVLDQNCTSQLEAREIQVTIACNDNVNISLSSNCEAEITPDALLEGLCNDDYRDYQIEVELLKVADNFMNPQGLTLPAIIENDSVVTLQIPGEYRYHVMLGDELACHGTFVVSDYSAPVCMPMGDEEKLINYDIDCDGTVEELVNDPSGVDDLADEYVLCSILEKNGHEIYFDELELRDAAFDLDGDGNLPYNADGSVNDADDLVADCDGDGINESSVCGDFKDCTGMESIYFEDEEINVCELADLQGLPIDIDKYDVNAFEVNRVYKRTWYGVDKNGIRTEQGCAQHVFGLRPKVSIIELAQEVTIDCQDDPMQIEEGAAPFFTVDNRIFNNGTGSDGPTDYDRDNDDNTAATPARDKVYPFLPDQITCDYVSAFHHDPQIPICTGSYKQVRHWTVVDYCDGERVYDEFTQQVVIMDTTAPEIVLSGTETAFPSPVTAEEIELGVDTIFNTQVFDCQVDGVLPLLVTKDNCATSTIDKITLERTVQAGHGEENIFVNSFENTDGTAANGGDLAELNLPAGTYTVTYFISDDCGNATTRSFTFATVDGRAPQAICNDVLNVTLIPSGIEGDQRARIYGEDLDDTSQDGCFGLVYEVRLGDGSNQPWSEYVELDCSAVADSMLKVELRVTEDRNDNGRVDANELSSICWGMVNIEDKTPPVLEIKDNDFTCDAPELNTLILETGDYTVEQADTAFPTVIGGCTAQNTTIRLTEVDVTNYDPICKVGQIERTFIAYRTADNNQAFGNEVTQTINVLFNSDWTMTFPSDVMVVCDENADSNLDNVPQPLQLEDILTNRGCDQWGLETEDEIFDIVGQDGDGACFKVIRTYKFINWCTWDPTNSELGVVPRPLDFFVADNQQVVLDYQSEFVLDICQLRNTIDDVAERVQDQYDLKIGNDGDNTSRDNITERDGDFIYFDESFDFNNQTVEQGNDEAGGGFFFSGDCIDGDDTGNSISNALFNTTLDLGTTATSIGNSLIDDEQSHNFVSAEAYGYFIYRQIIKVVDNKKPVIASIDDIEVCDEAGTCDGTIDLPIPTVEECKNSYTISYHIDLNQDGDSNDAGETGRFLGDAENGFIAPSINSVKYGTYPITYRVDDNCGNVSELDFNLTFKDCKPPVSYCRPLNADLMITGMVELWVTDFDAGSFDNCDQAVTLSFDAAGTQQSRVFTCDNIGAQLIPIYVTDAAGNQSFCEAQLVIQANDQTDCDQSSALLAGSIATEMGEMVENVTLNISGTQNMETITDVAGTYQTQLVMGGDYTIYPTKDDKPMNGVSTFDLVLLRKHILGIETLDSPYKLIAADANRSSSISTLDMVLIRKLILGLIDELPNNSSWRFVAKSFEFPNPSNPWETEFAELISHNNLNINELENDFVAVKIGDVNNSVVPNALLESDERETLPQWQIATEERQLQAGEVYEIPFYPVAVGIEGYQFTLNADIEQVEILEVLNSADNGEDAQAAGNTSVGNFNQQLLEDGILTASWDGDVLNDLEQPLFTLKVRAKAAALISEILEITNQLTHAEAYGTNGQQFDVSLLFQSYGRLAPESALYQNVPNPFYSQTIVPFDLAQAQKATLIITDAAGKVLYQLTDTYTAGEHEVIINSRDLPTTGVLFYTLETENYRATKRMILVK